MKKIVKLLKGILVGIVIVSISIAICMRSELNPISKRVPTIDSDVYIYIGQELNKGKVIYKDIFDHKGPLFHFIQYIGIKLSFEKYIGVWIIEVISMLIAITFLYKTAKLVTNNIALSILSVFMASVPLSLFFINGNYPEEYALPFVSVSLYFLIKYLKENKQITKIQDIIIGICFGCVCLIKLNLVIIWVIFSFVILINTIKEKNWKGLKQNIIYFSIGAMIPIIIATIALIFQQNLVECFKQYIIFNFKYSTNAIGDLKGTLEMFLVPIYCISVLGCMVDILYNKLCKKEEIMIPIVSLIYLVVSLLILIMPRNEYKHYGIILTPTYIVALGLLLKDFTEIFKSNKNIGRTILTIIILFFAILNITRRDIVTLKKETMMVNAKRFEIKETDLSKYIKENTMPKDNILVLGNECNIYLMAERSCNCKYVYQIPIVLIDSNIMKETIEEIKEKKPRMIVLKLTNYIEVTRQFYEYLNETNDYKIVDTFDNYEVYYYQK